MSSKADYSADEWKICLKASLMAGLAVVAASPSGPLGVLREMFAVGKLVSETRAQTGSNELLRALVSELGAPDARGQVDAAELRGLGTEQLRRTRSRPAGRSQSWSTGRPRRRRPRGSSAG
jgi:hypothetical protein